jgi:hypothetical protein
MAAAINEVTRNDAFGKDPAVVVDVFEKVVESRDPLREAALDHRPFFGGNHPRNKIIRKDALGTVIASIDREGDSLVEKCEIRHLLPLAELRGRKFEQTLMEWLVLCARGILPLEHLIVGSVELVVGERRLDTQREWAG